MTGTRRVHKIYTKKGIHKNKRSNFHQDLMLLEAYLAWAEYIDLEMS